MKRRILDWIVCPLCRSRLSLETIETGPDFEVQEGTLHCGLGHVFPIAAGVPRLLPASGSDGKAIKESFSREWQHFQYDHDRTWGQAVAERRDDFLRHTDMRSDSLAGKLVLDAGCGNGALSAAMSSFGCEVLATDISDGVAAAHQHLRPANTHYVQSDLMHPVFQEAIFDVVYCAGVLHHTPDTRATLEKVLRAVSPGGRIFLWLYWREAGVRARLSEALRRVLAPLPAPVKHALVAVGLLPQAVAREWLRAMLRGTRGLNWREVLVRQLDSYTPRYRWVHTPEEVHRWLREFGLEAVRTTEEGPCGFGVVAQRPADLLTARRPPHEVSVS